MTEKFWANAETQVAESPVAGQLISSSVTASLGDERARELRAHDAHMDWDQALAYILTQATRALSEPGPLTQQ